MQEYRNIFEEKLWKNGLELEYQGLDQSQDGKTCFIKVKCVLKSCQLPNCANYRIKDMYKAYCRGFRRQDKFVWGSMFASSCCCCCSAQVEKQMY